MPPDTQILLRTIHVNRLSQVEALSHSFCLIEVQQVREERRDTSSITGRQDKIWRHFLIQYNLLNTLWILGWWFADAETQEDWNYGFMCCTLLHIYHIILNLCFKCLGSSLGLTGKSQRIERKGSMPWNPLQFCTSWRKSRALSPSTDWDLGIVSWVKDWRSISGWGCSVGFRFADAVWLPLPAGSLSASPLLIWPPKWLCRKTFPGRRALCKRGLLAVEFQPA